MFIYSCLIIGISGDKSLLIKTKLSKKNQEEKKLSKIMISRQDQNKTMEVKIIFYFGF